MSKLVLDPDLRNRLNGLSEQIEVLDEQGKVVGLFLPAGLYERLIHAWANAQVTDGDLEKISLEPGGRSLAEIWKDLGRP
jgi:hypothetical protein